MQSVTSDSSQSLAKSTARNPFFPMVLVSATVFILTILAMVAVIFSDPRAPVVKFFDEHGGRLILAEVLVTLAVGFLALAVDRLQNRRKTSPPASEDVRPSAFPENSEKP